MTRSLFGPRLGGRSIFGPRVTSVQRRHVGGGGPAGFDPLSLEPLLWWKLNDGLGETAVDSSGNSHDGTLLSTLGDGPHWVSAPHALDFNSDDQDSVSLDGMLGNPSVATLAAWVDSDVSTTVSGGSNVVVLGDNLVMRINSSDGLLKGVYRYASSWHELKAGSGALIGTGWHHIAFVCDPSNGRQDIYVDGLLVGAANQTDPIAYVAGASATALGRNPTAEFFYDGRMHDVLVFPSALTTKQIVEVMEATA